MTEPTHHCLVAVRARRDRRQGGSRIPALGIVNGDLADLRGKVVEDRADGCEEETDEEERGQDRLGGQDRLPRLESLLLECCVWSIMVSS